MESSLTQVPYYKCICSDGRKGAVYPLIHLVLLIRNNYVTRGKLLFFLPRGGQPPRLPTCATTLPDSSTSPRSAWRREQAAHTRGRNQLCLCLHGFCRLRLLPPRYFPDPTSGWRAQPAHSVPSPHGAAPSAANTQGTHSTRKTGAGLEI